MPLQKGKSKRVRRANMGELMSSYEETGKIGTSRPKSVKAAAKQAYAVTMREAGMGRPKTKKAKPRARKTTKKRR